MEDYTAEMDYWYQRQPGSLVLQQERQLLSGLLQQKTGDHLVQLGGPSDLSLVESSSIQQRCYVSLSAVNRSFSSTTVVADQRSLPFMPGSIDAMVIAHVLGLVDNLPHFLSEVMLSLSPHGQVFLLGFNRWSLWRVQSLKAHWDDFPWCRHFYSLRVVVNALKRLGLQVVIHQTVGFRPLLMRSPQWQYFHFLETLGQLCCPSLGGVYFIVAQKNDPGMSPLKARKEESFGSIVPSCYHLTTLNPKDDTY